eukprot:scaffold164338_cov19-Tisochrysis_lutea.AAC.3
MYEMLTEYGGKIPPADQVVLDDTKENGGASSAGMLHDSMEGQAVQGMLHDRMGLQAVQGVLHDRMC